MGSGLCTPTGMTSVLRNEFHGSAVSSRSSSAHTNLYIVGSLLFLWVTTMLLRAGTVARGKGSSQSFVQKSVSGRAKEVGGAGRGCDKNNVGSEFGRIKAFRGQLAEGENGRVQYASMVLAASQWWAAQPWQKVQKQTGAHTLAQDVLDTRGARPECLVGPLQATQMQLRTIQPESPQPAVSSPAQLTWGSS